MSSILNEKTNIPLGLVITFTVFTITVVGAYSAIRAEIAIAKSEISSIKEDRDSIRFAVEGIAKDVAAIKISAAVSEAKQNTTLERIERLALSLKEFRKTGR